MNQETINTILGIVLPVVTALLGLLVAAGRQYLHTKIAAVQHDQLRAWIYDLVLSAEQQFAGIGSDDIKLNYVTEQAWAFVQSLGLTLTRDQVRALIEAAVRAMTANGAAVEKSLEPADTGTAGIVIGGVQ